MEPCRPVRLRVAAEEEEEVYLVAVVQVLVLVLWAEEACLDQVLDPR